MRSLSRSILTTLQSPQKLRRILVTADLGFMVALFVLGALFWARGDLAHAWALLAMGAAFGNSARMEANHLQ